MNNSTAYALPGCLKVPETFDYDKAFIRVCKVFNTDPVEVITSKKPRKRELVVTRQAAMTLAKLTSRMSLAQIGAKFNKDHATVLHSVKTIGNLRDTDRKFREDTDCLFKGLVFPVFKNKLK
ncbi:MAG: hypothetical protein KBD57_09320 [Bacteroidia bacterium]|nr:hypothetical protein [Bacteroidia bacterium]